MATPSTVTVTVAGRGYEVACDPGQEDRVKTLAADIDRRVAGLLKSVGAVGEARLLFMAALLIADELVDLKAVLADERTAGRGTESNVAEGIEALADRLDAIAARLENA